MDTVHLLFRDRRGSLEGLPLYLVILVIVAVFGLSIVIAWLNYIPEPQAIGAVTVDPDTIEVEGEISAEATPSSTVDMVVTVYDQDENPFSGVTIVLSGAGVYRAGTTGDDGTISFSMDGDDGARLGPWTQSATIQVTAQRSGYEDKVTSVIVVRNTENN